MPSLGVTNAALDVAAREGWKVPVSIARILAAHDAALDTAPVRALVLDRLARAIADGDVIEASAATVVLDTLPQESYFLRAAPSVENATIVALDNAIDGQDAYAFLADRFTATGRELTDAIKKVDPDMPAEEAAVMSSAPKSAAWASVPALRSTLDRLLAAEVQVLRDLAGVYVQTRPDPHPDDLLPLCVRYDKENADTLREIWTRKPIEAVMSTPRRDPHPGRAGLWGDIIAAGGVIEAHTSPSTLTRWPVPTVEVREPEYAALVNHPTGPKETAFYAGAPARREAADQVAAEAAGEPVRTDNSAALRAAAGLE
jgi:hypothetical protein